jgi:hypothetical protein
MNEVSRISLSNFKFAEQRRTQDSFGIQRQSMLNCAENERASDNELKSQSKQREKEQVLMLTPI